MQSKQNLVNVKVLRDFYDLREREDRKAGDEFSATASRAEEISTLLPGFVELSEKPSPVFGGEAAGPKKGQSPDLQGMTKAELLALAKERGARVSPQMPKAKIIDALEG